MSYRLINSNEIAIKYPEVNDMPCIYADIPNGLNGDFYDLSVYPKIVENFEQPTVDVLEQIRAEIAECLEAINHIKAMPIQLYTPNEIEARKLTYEQCLGFIDKYKTESEDKK